MVLFALGCLDLFPRRDVLNVLRLLFIQWQSYQLTCLGKIDFLKVDHAHSAIVLGVVVQHPVFRVVAGGPDGGTAHPGCLRLAGTFRRPEWDIEVVEDTEQLIDRLVAGGRRAGSLGRGNGPDETRWRGVIAG